MKKIGMFVVGLFLLAACTNRASLENKADSLGKKVDSLSNRVWDSGKKDIRELKQRIEDQFKKDSTVK